MKAPRPPSIAYAALAAMTALHLFAPGVQLVAAPWRPAGVVLFAAGVALAVRAKRMFAEEATALDPFARPRRLVRRGPFSWSRNPMYLGLVVATLGWAVALGSTMPFAVWAVFWIVLDRAFVAPEQRAMADAFGAEFAAYRGEVRRWF